MSDMITFTQAQSLGIGLKPNQLHVNSNQCMTKLDAITKYNIKATSMDGYADNRLVPKSTWVSAVSTYQIALSTTNTSATCSSYGTFFQVYSNSSVIQVPMTFYADIDLTLIYNGGGLAHYYQSGNQLLTINSSGSLTAISSCVADTTPPTATTAVSAAESGTNNIQVSWNTATDNVALSHYDIYRNGALIDSIAATSTSYVDSGLCNASYYYQIITKDTAGNASQLSSPSNTLTLTQSTTPCLQ